MKNNIYQFKVLLEDINPPIWRRIQVPEDFTFEELHKTIQLAMGWFNSHLHEFKTIEPRSNYRNYKTIKTPHPDDSDFDFGEIFDERKEKIKDWFFLEGENNKKKMRYSYDFGDGWEHMISFEKILPAENDVKYPRVIKGARACPVEDCGGVWGYMDIVKALKNPEKNKKFFDERFGGKEYFEDWMEDQGIDLENFDPEKFEIEEIYLEDMDIEEENDNFNLKDLAQEEELGFSEGKIGDVSINSKDGGMPAPMTIKVKFSQELETIIGIKEEDNYLSFGAPFEFLLQNIYFSYPEIFEKYKPGELGFTVNGKVPKTFELLLDGDLVEFFVN